MQQEQQTRTTTSTTSTHSMTTTTTTTSTTSTAELIAVQFGSAAIGALVGTTLTQPCEVIKLYSQSTLASTVTTSSSSSAATATSPLQLMSHLYRQHGYRALFRGLLPDLMMSLPARGLYLSLYDNIKSHLYRMNGVDRMTLNGLASNNNNHTLTNGNSSNSSNSSSSSSRGNESLLGIHALSAASASFLINTIVNPISFIKTRVILESRVNSVRYWEAVKMVYRTEGIRSFYSGIMASYLGISETIIYFTLFEELKRRYHLYYVLEGDAEVQGETGQANAQSPHIPLGHTVLLTAISKMTSLTLTYPQDLIKTRLREKGSIYSGVIDCCRQTVRSEGFLGLYKGMLSHTLRVLPSAAFALATYEYFTKLYMNQKTIVSNSPI